MSVKPYEEALNPVYISIVVPVYNEEENLEDFMVELDGALSTVGKTYEVIFVDDGSRDKSWDILVKLKSANSRIRIFQLAKNYGQHTAIFAGFEVSRGKVIVTIDADLQNPPDEIPKLLAGIEAGHDSVGGWRKNRRDPFLRKAISKFGNRVLERITGIKLKDYGCMLRAYRRDVVERIIELNEFSSFFIPALAFSYSKNPTEIAVDHREREKGVSKYNTLKLLKLNFDILTNSSLFPLQLITLLGIIFASLGALATVILSVLCVLLPEVRYIHVLIAVLFTFLGIQSILSGVLGEYVGRIYIEVRGKPRYVISKFE